MLGKKSEKNYDFKENAFLLQFEGNEYDVSEKIFNLKYYSDPIREMKQTGFFGILDALIDLKLTSDEITDFYIHGHIDPYDDPCEFVKGIIEIVYGMPKEEIKKQYGRYFSDIRIKKFPNPNNNTKMLMSFSYDEYDTYVFIPNKEDLERKFCYNYYRQYNPWDYYKEEKIFPKIDGKLYRAIRFLVRKGYDFPQIESLFDKSVKDIVFKNPSNGQAIILNKDYAYKMSDNLLSLVYFLKINNFKILNPESMFDPKYKNITLIDPKGKKMVLNSNYLEANVHKYINILAILNNKENFEVNIINLCDKRVKNIEIRPNNSSLKENNLTIKRDFLFSITEEWLKVIKKALNLGFSFHDSDNLFSMKQEILKTIDPMEKERIINRNQFINWLNIISILKQNGYTFQNYDDLFDENKPYIPCYNVRNQKVLINRQQIYKIVRILNLSLEDKRNLSDKEKDLLITLYDYEIRKKLFEWLPYTAKKWLPSSAVINKIPAEKSHEYFYNNNHKRLKILKDGYQANNYVEMEGIVSLGYILGLFDSKESTSEKALNYIIEYFLKKGTTADELHTIYGAIDLRNNFNKQFAEFFMQHYALNKEAFIEPDLGTNMTGELFENFADILANRPEKRVKTNTRNKLLTPIDAMASITDVKLNKLYKLYSKEISDERFRYLIQLLMKYGAGKEEIDWAIKLYSQALLIDEQKVSIPNIVDLKPNLMQFNSHLKSDPQAFLSGRKTNCCSRYGGFAEDRLTHVITDLNWRYVTFTSPNKTFFDGLVWYDKEEKIVCIDNVEGQFSKIDKNNTESIPMMADTFIRYADGIYHKMNELNIPCQKVNVGRDPGTASWEIFKYAKEQDLIYDDKNPCNYPKRNGISSDADYQFTITDEKMLRVRKKY